MKWFRVYSEIKDDPKMLELDDHQFRLWINLLALASESQPRGIIPGYRPRGLAAALRTDEGTLGSALTLFDELEMCDYDEETGEITIRNWNDRQYDKPSDTPEKTRERKARSRQRHADVTLSHATDTDTDTDTDTEENSSSSENASASRTIEKIRPEHTQLAELLEQRIHENNPEAKSATPKQLQNWANDVRLMVERDGRSIEQIRELLEWSQQDEFWRTNILSMGKFRAQYDQLLVKSRQVAVRGSPNGRKSNEPDYSGFDDFNRGMDAIDQRGPYRGP